MKNFEFIIEFLFKIQTQSRQEKTGDDLNFQFIFPFLGRRMTARQKKNVQSCSVIETSLKKFVSKTQCD